MHCFSSPLHRSAASKSQLVTVDARWLLSVSVCLVLLMQTGCRTSYYEVMEKFGQHKRDLLRQSLIDATEQQRDVEEQFKDALTRLQELTDSSGGELQERYEAFKSEYESSYRKPTVYSLIFERLNRSQMTCLTNGSQRLLKFKVRA